MSSAAPFAALPENDRVWFAGATIAPRLLDASARAAARLHASEWLRPFFDGADWETNPAVAPARWVIDFPPALDRATAERQGVAWETFHAAGGRVPRSGDAAELRIALAKLERCFVARARSGRLRWHALDAAMLPGRGLLVLARDDEFCAAIAGSRWCELWRRARGGRTSPSALRSFPLPWPPATLRSALSREQEERRDAVIRVWRTGDDEETDGHVAAAYGWRVTIEDDEALRKLVTLHGTRLTEPGLLSR